MATGPEAFSRCLNAYLPVEADASGHLLRRYVLCASWESLRLCRSKQLRGWPFLQTSDPP
eukprot:scaffold35324_cov58-Phaeocystis_antarctica.AAC.2